MLRKVPVLIGAAVLGIALLGYFLLTAPAEKRSLHAMIEADQASGIVTMSCTESSSGTCYALFVTGDTVERLAVKVGNSAGDTGITAETRYCIDTIEPAEGCTLKPLAEGQQIVRRQKGK
jgi:hypothetical protein